MKELYFPNIIVKEDAWLKYSLLYKKELYTIKPTNFYNLNYGPINSRIGEEFLKPYDPESYLSIKDSQETSFEDLLIGYMSQINAHREQFKIPYLNMLLDDNLRLSPKNSTLFKGKFTNEIERFVIDLGYGENHNNNIKVSNRFAIIYMGLLAEHIAHMDSSVSLVSKPMNVRKYLNNSHILAEGSFLLKYYKSHMSEERYKNNLISHILPRNINTLTIEEISHIRTTSYLKELDRFNSLMDKLFERGFVFEEGSDLYREILSIKGALNDMISSKLGKTAITLGVNVGLNQLDLPFLMTEALSLGLSATLDKFDGNGSLGFRDKIATLKILTTINAI